MAIAPVQRPRQKASPAVSPRAAVHVQAQPFAWVGVLAVSALLMAVHLYCINQYGFFRDELYYIACAKRMDWGFVDQPPLSVGLLRLIAGPLGYPLWLVRLPAVACGVISCVLSACTARELGGKRFSQFLAALGPAVAGTVLVVTHLYSMNSVDILLWSAAAYLWAGLSTESKTQAWRWLALGLVIGIACLNKLSSLWLLGGIAVATLFTPRRADLKTAYPWMAVVLILAGLAPNILWQAGNHWITYEFLHNAFERKLLHIQPWIFAARELVVLNPIALPLWLVGLVATIAQPKWRAMGLVYLTVLTILLLSGKSRENYLTPAYFFLYAPGAVIFESWMAKAKPLVISYAALLALSGFGVACVVLPILPQAKTAEVISRLKEIAPTKIPDSEKGQKNNLEGLADMNGWPEMAAAVDQVYLSLSPADRAQAVVYTHNYGEAAAIEYFTKIPGLHVTGRHNNYWLWGPGAWNGHTAIVVGDVPPEVRNSFATFSVQKTLNLQYAAPEEASAQIAVAHNLKEPVDRFWIENRRID